MNPSTSFNLIAEMSSSSSSSSSNTPTVSISITSDPLLSTLLSFFALTLLYFPRLLWRILFSPIFLLTGFLLLSLLRLGATQRSFLRQTNDNNNQIECEESAENDAAVQSESSTAVSESVSGGSKCADSVSCKCFEESFVQWNVRAPLEVIYEEYEGEDHDKEASNESDPEPRQVRIGLERYPSLSLYYPETDSDSSSEDNFPTTGDWDSLDDHLCLMWDEDEDRDELIEIALDKTNKKASEFLLEEDNLIEIEIDISPIRKSDEFPHEK
ncbi:uncharacterized protein LOC111497433 [Cucurbita maxima]|uniref:Uncharacterized protein LOC111497433 n=1 Tax=Cucurbita maxima TaxID=3661 RepID=A0A6J1KY66_CUCMA|nr:uncharacterized protein LOC111497433 [Cucurbita maxima]XP_023003983.1 uncharacterized protein LOC111497433 [Cucurbita maxima]